jgi:predicted nucleotidyltransferase component of viral defense system
VSGLEWRRISLLYPDLTKFRVLSYTLLEILVEKIRSIIQRGYSRDYYDVWRLLNETRFNESDVRELLVKKCENRGVEYKPELIFDTTRLKEAKAFWEKGLAYLTRDLPNFERVIEELHNKLVFL